MKMNRYQEKIYDYLLEQISTGQLSVGQKIPTEYELKAMFHTTRMNAHFAVKNLGKFGILKRNKRRGTFIKKIPNHVVQNELKVINKRQVCVLNHNKQSVNDIHWNSRIVDNLTKQLQEDNIEVAFKSISHLNTKQELANFIKNTVEEGCNSLVIVNDEFIHEALSSYPEILFYFHNDIFIFERTGHWYKWPYNMVGVNLFREGVTVAEYLIENGYDKIFFVEVDVYATWVKERKRGLRFGLLRWSESKIKLKSIKLNNYEEKNIVDKLKADPNCAIVGQNNDGHKTIIDIIKTNPNCAIVAQNDELAVQILIATRQHNLEPKIDFGLIGFDNNIKYQEFNLTTVSPPLEKMGLELSKLIKSSINGNCQDKTHTVFIDSNLIIRDTC